VVEAGWGNPDRCAENSEAEIVKRVRLRLEGEYEDAFLYMGRLVLVSVDGKILVVPLARMLDRLASGPARRLLRVLFEHTNHMTVQGLIAAAGSAENANSELAALAVADLSTHPDPESEIDLGLNVTAPLDVLLYYRRLYLATDRGLFSRDIDFDSAVATASGKTSRRTEPGCLAVSARYGTVNASCEEDGLFQSVDEFGWLMPRRDHHMRHIASESRRTSWLHDGFVNYRNNESYSLFTTIRVPVPQQDGEEEEEHWAIASVERRINDDRIDRELAAVGISADDIQHVWSSLNGVFVQSQKGLVFVRLPADEDDSESELVRLGAGFESVLWAGTFGRGTVIETDESVVAFENHQQLAVETRPVIATRTFPNSVRYRRIVATVAEDSVVLTSVLRDYMFRLET
jgi:hypothetical protein